jgi:hypothetical protein
VETRRAPAPGSLGAVTHFGYADGEILIRFTPIGEKAAAPLVGRPPTRLLFGDPAIDTLNTKYRATALVPLQDGLSTYRMVLSRDANVLRAAEEYGALPLVLSAEPNYTYRIPRPEEAPGAVRTEVRPAGSR